MNNFILNIKLRIGLILLILTGSAGCTSQSKIVTDIIPQETFQTHLLNTNCASIMSNNFNVSVQEIKKDDISSILRNKNFKNKNIQYTATRFPRLILFLISIENTGDIQLNPGEINIQYNNIKLKSLDPGILGKMYNSRPYSAINFDEILSLYRLESDDICDSGIDFTTGLEKHIGPIKSGEKVFQIAAFDWLPTGVRKFNLSINVKSDIIKKIIDFKLMRSEYRHSGEYFIKPVDDNINY